MDAILIIDDDDFIRKVVKSVLQKAGYRVFEAVDGESGLNIVKSEKLELVITDYKMPGLSGLEVVEHIAHTQPGLPVIMLTGYGDVELTIKAIQAGAYDYIEKPVKNQELLEAIKNGVKASAHSKSLKQIIAPEARKEIEENLPAGKSTIMREIFKNIGRISLNNINVVLLGEMGTGKEQLARLIHYSGIGRDHPFVTVYCNKTQEPEQELFGYVDVNSGIEKIGKLEMAGAGTIFIDDVAEMPLLVQDKLLWAFKNEGFEKSGGQNLVPLKARFVVATDKNIEEMIAESKFSKELYFLLKMFAIILPPLRDRKDDIPELVRALLIRLNRKYNRHVVKVERGVMEMLQKYHWPGNLQELENTITQAMFLTHGDVLEKKNIPTPGKVEIIDSFNETSYLKSLPEIEKVHIKKVLDAVDWSKMEASRILQITRPTLNKKIEKYGLTGKKKK